MATISRLLCSARNWSVRLRTDCRGIAATEFAIIVPLMLVMFFGVIEITSGFAVDRKVTLVARTLSDLTSQGDSTNPSLVNDTDLTNFFTASYGLLWPYEVTPVTATLSGVYVDTSGTAKVQWSKSAAVAIVSNKLTTTLTSSTHKQGDVVTLPTGLAVKDTYLIWSEVEYDYKPTIGYVMSKAGLTLKDQTFTRPRQTKCVTYGSVVCPS
jgi:Flp pilus assembly protein TadG